MNGLQASNRRWDIREIASPRFAHLVNLAASEGLLVPILAGRAAEVQKYVSAEIPRLEALIIQSNLEAEALSATHHAERLKSA